MEVLGLGANVDQGLWHTRSLYEPLLIRMAAIMQLIVLFPDALIIHLFRCDMYKAF